MSRVTSYRIDFRLRRAKGKTYEREGAFVRAVDAKGCGHFRIQLTDRFGSWM